MTFSTPRREHPAVQREYDTIEVSSVTQPTYLYNEEGWWGSLTGEMDTEIFQFSAEPNGTAEKYLWGFDVAANMYASNTATEGIIGAQLSLKVYDGPPAEGSLITSWIKRYPMNATDVLHECLCLEQPIKLSKNSIYVVPTLRHFASDGTLDSTTTNYQQLLAGFIFTAYYNTIPLNPIP